LARHEPHIQAAKDGPLSLKELLVLLGDAKAGAERERQEAFACDLSASEGWSEAVQRLDGAFAAEVRELKDRKSD
jgi:hypothetical protein